jgi:inorganic triphosphatase YgiF
MLRNFVFVNTYSMPTKDSSHRHALKRVSQISICTVAALVMCGCASTYRQGDAASDSLNKAATEIRAESQAIDATLASLDNLVNQPGPDLRPQYARYSHSLERLVAASKRAEKSAEEAKQKSADFFESWDKKTADIKYEAVRDQSVSRKTQVSDEFNTVNSRYRENQSVIEPLISYLEDIRTALSTDLTMGGIQSVKTLADNAAQNAQKVQTALARLSDELYDSGARMSSVGPRNQPTAVGGAGESTETDQQQVQSSTLNQ